MWVENTGRLLSSRTCQAMQHVLVIFPCGFDFTMSLCRQMLKGWERGWDVQCVGTKTFDRDEFDDYLCVHIIRTHRHCSHQEEAVVSRVVTLPESACSASYFSLSPVMRQDVPVGWQPWHIQVFYKMLFLEQLRKADFSKPCWYCSSSNLVSEF